MWLGSTPTYKYLIKDVFTSSPPNEFVRVSDENNDHRYVGSVYEIPKYNFDSNNGGWTTTSSSGAPFVWESGRWYINGSNNKQAFLISPSLLKNSYKIVVEHKWNFGSSNNYGQLQYSTNNGTSWITIPSVLFKMNGYTTSDGWTGLQKNYIFSECFLNDISLTGSSILIRLRGVWGNTALASNPNWDISSISIEGLGSVRYTYQITQYPITNNEYCLFLNSVDPNASNPNDIYSASMSSSTRGGITQSATGPKRYRYRVKTNMGNKPVNFVNWWRAARYCNWLHNGGRVYNITNSSATAPQNIGAYNVGTSTTGTSVILPSANAKFTIPTLDEWIKAGYYQGGTSAEYWAYPTQYNTPPECVDIISSGGDPIITPIYLTYLESDIIIRNLSEDNLLCSSALMSDTLVRSSGVEFLANSQLSCDALVRSSGVEFLANSQLSCDALVRSSGVEFLANSQLSCDVLIRIED